MTVSEFSNEFDVLVDSYRRFKDFDRQEGLDSLEFNEYEKSLYLTAAQEELILSLYNGRNSSLQSFEETEELRRHLSDLIVEAELSPLASLSGKLIGIDSRSKFFTLPDDCWFITFEKVLLTEGKCENHTTMEVVPVRQDEYHKIKKNPFRGINDRRALRLDLSDGVVEIVCKYTVNSYYIRYVRKLEPVVLIDLPNSLTIGGHSMINECKVHEGLHRKVLEIAVEKAVQSKIGGKNPSTVERGKTNNRE